MAPPILFAFFVRWHEVEWDLLIWTVGGSAFVAGILLRIWAQMHIHYRLGVPKALTTTGPYAFTRNPIYTANTLIICSLVMLLELVWFVPVALAWCIFVYSLVIRYEESDLLRRYGSAYRNYMRAVPRWIPRFIRHGDMPASGSSYRTWLWPSIRAEMHCVLWVVIPLLKEFLL